MDTICANGTGDTNYDYELMDDIILNWIFYILMICIPIFIGTDCVYTKRNITNYE